MVLGEKHGTNYLPCTYSQVFFFENQEFFNVSS